jgi:hypothetical protein
MIEDKFYFILHAPRQSGKTTFLKFLTNKINTEGKYYALTCSLASLININDRCEAMTIAIEQINKFMISSQIQQIKDKAYTYNSLPQMADSSTKINTILNHLCEDLDKDLIVFFDEADCLSGPGLITFLSQILDAYQIRDEPGNKFPRSMALVGMRDIRDYLVQARDSQSSRGVASPFNIKKEAFTLPNFTQDEIQILYEQHTEASGQTFLDAAIDRAWHWSEGQPWLVNALAYESVVNILRKNYSQPITSDIMNQSAENLIKRQDTHLDSLLERLKEPRVRAVMEPIIIGADFIPLNVPPDDIRYTEDLGILKNNNGNHQPANPIYNEVIMRSLSYQFERLFNNEVALAKSNRWVDGQKLNMTSLLKAFQQ